MQKQIGRSKWTIWVLMVSSLATILLGNGCLGQAGRPSLTTDTWSRQFATEEAKLAFLQHYLKLTTPVQATAFHIIYHDNSGGIVPGPSDWDILSLLKVRPGDLAQWTLDMQPVPSAQIDLAWAKSFSTQDATWQLTSQPQIYQKAGMIIAIFQPESIVFIRTTTQP
jgi:hypothetical protein